MKRTAGDSQNRLFDLTKNRKLTGQEVGRCLEIVRHIELAANRNDGTADESHWQSPTGHCVLDHVEKIDFSKIDEGYLNRLRLHSHIFTGVRLTNLLGETSIPDWNDVFIDHFPSDAVDWCIPAFYEYIHGLPKEYICVPPLVMGEVGYCADGFCVNRDVIAYQERVNLLRGFGCFDRLLRKKDPVIVEIGGGYGALAYYVKKIVPHATYYIVDLPRPLIFSGCYLCVTLPGHEIKVYGPQNGKAAPGSIPLVVNQMLEGLNGLGIDLAINTLSFAEMPSMTVLKYAKFISRHLNADGKLFEQNYDNSKLNNENFSNPEEILKGIFPGVETAKTRTLWGPARLWSMS